MSKNGLEFLSKPTQNQLGILVIMNTPLPSAQKCGVHPRRLLHCSRTFRSLAQVCELSPGRYPQPSVHAISTRTDVGKSHSGPLKGKCRAAVIPGNRVLSTTTTADLVNSQNGSIALNPCQSKVERDVGHPPALSGSELSINPRVNKFEYVPRCLRRVAWPAAARVNCRPRKRVTGNLCGT